MCLSLLQLRSAYHSSVVAELARRIAAKLVEVRSVGCCDAEDDEGQDNRSETQVPLPAK